MASESVTPEIVEAVARSMARKYDKRYTPANRGTSNQADLGEYATKGTKVSWRNDLTRTRAKRALYQRQD